MNEVAKVIFMYLVVLDIFDDYDKINIFETLY